MSAAAEILGEVVDLEHFDELATGSIEIFGAPESESDSEPAADDESVLPLDGAYSELPELPVHDSTPGNVEITCAGLPDEAIAHAHQAAAAIAAEHAHAEANASTHHFEVSTPAQLRDEAEPTDWNEIVEGASDFAPDLESAPQADFAPAFRQYIERRASQSRAMLEHVPAEGVWRDWQIDFGPASAPAGEVLTFFNSPQVLFRGEKVTATDTGATPGNGTRILTITVGQKVQRPNGTRGTLTAFFGSSALGNGIKWDTADRALTIAVQVSFIEACTFDLTVFGKCVL